MVNWCPKEQKLAVILQLLLLLQVLTVVTVTVAVTDVDVVVIALTISSSLLINAPGRNYYDFTLLYHFTCRFFRLVSAIPMPTTTIGTLCAANRSSII